MGDQGLASPSLTYVEASAAHVQGWEQRMLVGWCVVHRNHLTAASPFSGRLGGGSVLGLKEWGWGPSIVPLPPANPPRPRKRLGKLVSQPLSFRNCPCEGET